MIRRRASAVVLLRDGFTGAALAGGGTLCRLDGRPLRPLWKPEGYLVLQDLAPGEHRLTLRRAGFREAALALTAADGALWEATVDLHPDETYPFPRETACLRLTVTQTKRGSLAGETLWLGMAGRAQLRLAQDRGEKPGLQVRLFCQGSPGWLPIPGHYLVADEKAPEVVSLRALQGETGLLEAPMAGSHGRGTEWIPVQPYQLEGDSLTVRFPRAGTASLFCRGRWRQAPLAEGEQSVQWNIDGG